MIRQGGSAIRLVQPLPDFPVQLVETPDNPIPRRGNVMRIETEDGLALRAARWRPTARRDRGTICILQGRAEFIEKYFETVRDLRRRGFAVVAFDWRGQGLSDRQIGDPYKGHVRSFGEYSLDLEAIRANVLEPYMPKPHFGLAHSMGGAIALVEAREGRLPFERLVTTGPMLALCLVKSPNAAAASALGHGAIGDPTVAWMNAAFRFMRKFADPRFPRDIRTPTLIVAAGADPICATPVIERFAARLKAGHAIVLPGARHEILMERDAIREEFWAAFDAFVPGTPDPTFDYSAVEELERGVVDAAVAGGA